MTTFAQNVSRLMAATGLTQSGFSSYTGVSRRTLGRIFELSISGKGTEYRPSYDTVVSIATAARVAPEDILKKRLKFERTKAQKSKKAAKN